ncbi:MAG: OmpA family protein [Verrucomicrobiota bacterium]
MNSHFATFGVIFAIAAPVSAQDTVIPVTPVPGAPSVVEKKVTETVDPAGRTTVVEEVTETVPGPAAVPPLRPLDPAIMQRHLEIAPRVIPVDPAAPKVETTETTTVTRKGRVYNVKTNTVVVEGRELPYVAIPVLFEKETAKLLDTESRTALDVTSAAIKNVLKSNPTAVFEIEGHTSTDGEEDFNLKLSADRARRVLDELTLRYEVPAAVLTANGYGESYPNYPQGSEPEMMLDRRVLVVRVK